MSELKQTQRNQPTKTNAQIKNEAADTLTIAYTRVKKIQENLNAALFDNGIDSDVFFNALGNKAKVYVKFNELLIHALEVIANEDGIDPEAQKPPFNYEKNPDGTITLDKANPFDPQSKK
jgi:hypothetical protein